MLEKDLDKMISSHKSEGMLEEANLLKNINNETFYFNVFTLKLRRIKNSKLDVNYLNAKILKRIKRNPQLYKEVREYNLVFRFFNKLNIKDGYIKKSETPDFILERNHKKYGIEVTRIYTGNDWVAEKLHNDIIANRLQDKNLLNYINDKKYDDKIKTYTTQKGVVVKAIKDKALRDEEITQIKNKLFEKIRKQIDDYRKYDYNYIFAEVVFADYEELDKLEKLNEEIIFFVSHLDVIWSNAEFHLILKIGNSWNDFDLKRGICTRGHPLKVHIKIVYGMEEK